MKNIALYIGIALIVAGAIVGQLSGIEAAKWIELAGFAAGLATCVVSFVKNDKVKKGWKFWTAIVCIILGTFALIGAGVSENTISTVISTVIGVVALIGGVIATIFTLKDSKE